MIRPAPTVTVPVDPTEAMLVAGVNAWPDDDASAPVSKIYAAMIAAAPAAPQAAGVGEVTQAENPGGYLIKDFADGWFWTPHRIAAVAALTDGHAVYDLRAQPQARSGEGQ